jgi:hypothetical protein
VRLSRWDLFHGHLFACHRQGALGVLFHCQEYPAFDARTFPLSLGYCQAGSDVSYEARAMDWRNVLWYQVGAWRPHVRARVGVGGLWRVGGSARARCHRQHMAGWAGGLEQLPLPWLEASAGAGWRLAAGWWQGPGRLAQLAAAPPSAAAAAAQGLGRLRAACGLPGLPGAARPLPACCGDAHHSDISQSVIAQAPPPPPLQGRLAALDLSPSSPLHGALLLEGTAELRTVYEDRFGLPLADVTYLAGAPGARAAERVLVAC